VKAGLVSAPGEYPWSSARDHLFWTADPLVKESPVKEIIGDWAMFLERSTEEKANNLFRRAERTGRPIGGDQFVESLEKQLGRTLRPEKPPKKS
jgi:putative transposase